MKLIRVTLLEIIAIMILTYCDKKLNFAFWYNFRIINRNFGNMGNIDVFGNSKLIVLVHNKFARLRIVTFVMKIIID